MTHVGTSLEPVLVRPSGRDRLRQLAVVAAVLALVAGVVAAVLLSPVLLGLVAERSSADWNTLSAVGETYGAASALVSALALAAVAVSLGFQARQADVQQIQTVRMLHVELTKMALAEPELYLPCWRPIADAPAIADKKQHLYQNLLITYVWMSYELSGLHEGEVRHLLSRIFEGEAPRRYWARVNEGWMPTFVRSSQQGKGKRFRELVTEEFANAEARGPATSPARFPPDPVPPPPPRPVEPRGAVWRGAGSHALMAAGGLALGALLARRRRA